MSSTRLVLVFCAFLVVLGTTVHGQSPRRAERTPAADGLLPPMTDWFLSTGDWDHDPQLYVREFGRGSEPVIMVHGGWGAEHSGLIEAVRALEERYRFIFYDQRGSLRSPSPDALITFDRHIEDLELLRQALGLETVTIVAHSMGAILASAYASKYPARIRQLVLLAPARLKNPFPDADKALLDSQNAALERFLNRPEVAEELGKYGLNRSDRPLTSQEATAKFRINLYRRMLYDIASWPLLTGGRGMFRPHVGPLTEKTYPTSGWDYVSEFKRRTYQVGIIVGDHDFIDFGNGLIKKWTQDNPRITLTIVEKAGHLLWIDQPGVLADALSRHLRAPASAAR